MNSYIITKNDIVKRIYFITKLVQNQKGSTMQGALTSKSDSMGGIFDRFINTLSDSLVFDKIVFQKDAFRRLKKQISVLEDFYYYKPSSNSAGIAPDIFGIIVDGIKIPFAKFNNKWFPIPGKPQIEVKTFKAKDQMISLRNQNYEEEYLVLVDLDMRIDYLVPFLDKSLLSSQIANEMQMDDSLFIVKDDKNRITRISNIDFSDETIGTLKLISITNATDFMNQSTFCDGNISIRRMKEIVKRKVLIKKNLLSDKLSTYANVSPRNNKLYEFNQNWIKHFEIKDNVKCLDFSADNIQDISIVSYNKDGVVLSANSQNCTFNGEKLVKGSQYTVKFDTLDRSGNNGSEYFMQKQCAIYLNGVEHQLTNELLKIINEGE